eukprot:Rmarinus@m.13252
MRLFFFLCALALLSIPASALYSRNDDVVQLTPKSFRSEVLKDTRSVWMVEFYAPWCGHCKNLAPEYKKAASNLNGLVKLGAVDCDKYRDLCGRYDVRGFPTIKVFPADKKGRENPFDYQGERRAGAISKFMTSQVPAKHISKVKNTKAFDDLLEKSSDKPLCVLFSEKDKASTLYKSISLFFHDEMMFTQVPSDMSDITARYGISSYPTVLVVVPGEEEPRVFDGELDRESLRAFLADVAGVDLSDAGKSESKSSKSKKSSGADDSEETDEPAAPPRKRGVTHAKTPEDFVNACVEPGGLCLAAVLDPTNADATKHVEALTEAEKLDGGSFHFVYTEANYVNFDFVQATGMSEMLPSATVINTNKNAAAPFVGSFSVDGIHSFLNDVLRGRTRAYPLRGDSLPNLVTNNPIDDTYVDEPLDDLYGDDEKVEL